MTQPDGFREPDAFDQVKADAKRRLYLVRPGLVQLRQLVEQLPPMNQLALGLCCCERLYPNYEFVAQAEHMPDVLRPILDGLWRHVAGDRMTFPELAAALAICNSTTVGDMNEDIAWDASEALIAASCTLNACKGDSAHNIVMACESARNTVYQELSKKYSPDYGGFLRPEDLAEFHSRIDSDPEMDREMRIQSGQLHFLMDHEQIGNDQRKQLLELNRPRPVA